MIEQNTPEWHAMRKDRIGSSDAPVVMQVSPYKTPYQLWQEKLQLDAPTHQTSAMKRGLDLEPRARAVLEKELGMPLFPNTKLHNRISWLMASLDAMSFDERTIAEIKCPGKDDHAMAKAGKVPEKYFPQLQHQIEVCEVDMAYYFSFDGQKGVVIKVFRDEKYIKQLLEAEEKFFECMKNFEAPPLTDRDYEVRTEPEWEHLAKRLQFIQSLEDEKEEIRKQLIAMCNGQSSMGAGIKVSKCMRKGNVDYAKVPELKGLNLEPYRKKSTEYWRIA